MWNKIKRYGSITLQVILVISCLSILIPQLQPAFFKAKPPTDVIIAPDSTISPPPVLPHQPPQQKAPRGLINRILKPSKVPPPIIKPESPDMPEISDMPEEPKISPSEAEEPYTWGLINRIRKGRPKAKQMASTEPLNSLPISTFSTHEFETARKAGTPIFIHFSSKGCTQCVAEWALVKKSALVEAANKQNIKIFDVYVEEFPASPEIQKLMSEYEVGGFPTYLFIDKNNKHFSFTNLNLLWATSNLLDGFKQIASY